MRKYFSMVFIGFLLFLTGCEKETIYHKSYIQKHGGIFYLEFAYMKEDSYGKEEPLRILKVQEGQNQDYETLYSISSKDYEKNDIVLITDTFFYIFNQNKKKENRILSYSLNDNKKKFPNQIRKKTIPSIVTVQGVHDSYLYVSYKNGKETKYLKISEDLKRISYIQEKEIPLKMDYAIQKG